MQIIVISVVVGIFYLRKNQKEIYQKYYVKCHKPT